MDSFFVYEQVIHQSGCKPDLLLPRQKPGRPRPGPAARAPTPGAIALWITQKETRSHPLAKHSLTPHLPHLRLFHLQ